MISMSARFVHTFQLVTGSYELRELEKRFNAGQQLYNGVLKECLSRFDVLMRSDLTQALVI